jgi:hypothetical protein
MSINLHVQIFVYILEKAHKKSVVCKWNTFVETNFSSILLSSTNVRRTPRERKTPEMVSRVVGGRV